MSAQHQSQDRLLDLLADRVSRGLGSAESDELNVLLRKEPGMRAGHFELAAAAVELTQLPNIALPAGLDAKLASTATRWVGAGRAASPETEPSSTNVTSIDRGRAAPSVRSTSGAWWLAAACAALAAVGWWSALRPPEAVDSPPPVVAEIPLGERVRAAADSLVIPWTATEDPSATGAVGEVAWSGNLQEGYMLMRGLEVNDPTVSQYQLWIFDAEQDERYPIDGGVFDVTGTETIVPIDAKLDVSQPTLFAITVEKPGGVVVSDRERIVLVAPVAAG